MFLVGFREGLILTQTASHSDRQLLIQNNSAVMTDETMSVKKYTLKLSL